MIGETPARLTVHKLACGTCATERSRQQRNGPEADFGGARELPCNKQGVSQLSPPWAKTDSTSRHGDTCREQAISHPVLRKMTSESPDCLDCPNGVWGSFAAPLLKSTYVRLTENAHCALLKNSTGKGHKGGMPTSRSCGLLPDWRPTADAADAEVRLRHHNGQ